MFPICVHFSFILKPLRLESTSGLSKFPSKVDTYSITRKCERKREREDERERERERMKEKERERESERVSA